MKKSILISSGVLTTVCVAAFSFLNWTTNPDQAGASCCQPAADSQEASNTCAPAAACGTTATVTADHSGCQPAAESQVVSNTCAPAGACGSKATVTANHTGCQPASTTSVEVTTTADVKTGCKTEATCKPAQTSNTETAKTLAELD